MLMLRGEVTWKLLAFKASSLVVAYGVRLTESSFDARNRGEMAVILFCFPFNCVLTVLVSALAAKSLLLALLVSAVLNVLVKT